jgi:hypothetical protein
MCDPRAAPDQIVAAMTIFRNSDGRTP